MTARTVTTQADLDAVLADNTCDEIRIMSEAGVWLQVGQTGDKWVHAGGSATVHAYDSATVRAYDSATVTAYGSARVTAYDSATVHAGRYVAVHLHSARATISGGVVIDVSALDLADAATWCDMQGVDVADGQAVVFKAADARLASGYGTTYPIGETVTAPDWQPIAECGSGLHFGPTPGHAQAYYQGEGTPRFLACSIDVSEAVGLTGGTAKIKARSCRVLYEVDLAGRRIGEVTP